MSMKNPVTPAGIEPATFRFVAQHLNHCATAVPPFYNSLLNLLLYLHDFHFKVISISSYTQLLTAQPSQKSCRKIPKSHCNFVTSVCTFAGKNSVPTIRIFMKFGVCCRNCTLKIEVTLNFVKNNGKLGTKTYVQLCSYLVHLFLE